MSAPALRARTAGNPEALPEDLHPVLRRIYASRGIRNADELSLDLAHLHRPELLKGIEPACALLDEALRADRRIVIAGDYDADGATGTALAVGGLRALGGRHVDFLVPSRFRDGYGLTPALVEAAQGLGAQLLVTVDNGIASVAGVAAARAAGMQVIVTDHHLPGPKLPDADAIVNPNQPGCGFPSRNLAGVGVVFYLLTALRRRMRERGAFGSGDGPNLAEALDLVATGTVADVVRLDHNNRILVAQGLRRIRAGRARPGLAALLAIAGRKAERASARDLGYAVGPRLNAAGRLEDMRLGIECLLAGSPEAAEPLARRLEALNHERRGIEAKMQEDALERLKDIHSDAVGVCLFDPGWHEGVVGLVASRVKDRLHRPTIAFARAEERGLLKGSARSIQGLHIRDALAAVDARNPGLVRRFGGHAMAAGLTLPESSLPAFSAEFDAVCRAGVDESTLARVVETDGELGPAELTLETARALEDAGPWGQGFPEPLFDGSFEVAEIRPVGEDHVKYLLRAAGGALVAAIHFRGAAGAVTSGRVHALYRPAVNRWNDAERFELVVDRLWPAPPVP